MLDRNPAKHHLPALITAVSSDAVSRADLEISHLRVTMIAAAAPALQNVVPDASDRGLDY
jgi:hypothetical protein